MKTACFLLIVGVLLANSVVDGFKISEGDRTITKVVKLLKKMLEKSTKEAEDDKEAYAKYKCYVDTNEAEKKESIATETRNIETLESRIAELQAQNGELMQQTAALNTDMRANKAAQKSATSVRESSKKAFDAMEEDLEKGIGQMAEAINVLTSLGLSQNEVSVHKKEAALLSLGSKVRQSLFAASALLSPENRQTLEAFLQAPLSAAHSQQGDAITGVLKSLKENFENNLKNARDSEKAEKEAFKDSIDILESSWKTMEKSLKEKESLMGSNDTELGSSSTALDKSIKQKAADEEFLEKLLEMAATKAKNYKERKMLRANEDAAIAECISILNSDEAFSTFGTTDATSSGALKGAASFLQLRKLRGTSTLKQAENILEQAAAKGHSMRLAKVAGQIRAGHAFSTVLDEIEKMKKTIVEEGQADKENLDWCNSERTNSNKDLDAKKSQIKTLKSAIDKLDDTINAPETGLKDLITAKETALVQNKQAQTEQTKARNEENAAYQEDVSNLSNAEDILAKAIKVLARYYDQLDKHLADGGGKAAFVQEDPKPPATYDDFEGQKGKGNEAIEMLEFILKETKTEHSTADADEKSAQKDYDDSMTKLKSDEADMQKALVDLKADLTSAVRELQEKRSDLKDTTAAKEAIEKYLEDIKPGCDFITENFEVREKNRATETTALNKAKGLIKDTPAYKAAVAREEEIANGKCNSECKLDNSSLRCKACIAGSSKADYCKANPGQAGCK